MWSQKWSSHQGRALHQQQDSDPRLPASKGTNLCVLPPTAWRTCTVKLVFLPVA